MAGDHISKQVKSASLYTLSNTSCSFSFHAVEVLQLEKRR